MVNSFPSLRLIFICLGVSLLIIVLTLGSLLLLSRSRTQPPPAAILELARAGVQKNSDWQPITRRLDDLDLALVPAGCFTMGSTAPQLAQAIDSCERFFGVGKCLLDIEQAETPPHELCFDQPFWIGVTEVTNRQYGSSSSTKLRDMYRGPSWPRETVTWQQAAQFCQAHDARLPTEAEWEFSARGPDGLIFPWGNEFQLEKLISGRQHPANVASVPAGVSWVGASDLSGNVAEWVADGYAAYPQVRSTEAHPLAQGQGRVVRGGSWFSYAGFFVRAANRESASPDTANSTIGFRCARALD